MKSACFLDTNILIYAVAGKQDEARKHQIAVNLLREADFGLSGQVLAELSAVLRRKFEKAVSVDQLDAWLEELSQFPVIPVDANLVRTANLIAARFDVSYYDAAIIAAAERLDAAVLYSEDLNSGQIYGSVRVINPFLPR
jgi:predicted nucleic acid-binding protein